MLMLVLGSFCLLSTVFADVYMHNPRGSNDRNCERNENRNNGNRLFDSQNNAKGGYACPRAVGGPEIKETNMYYYVGSVLPVQWTAQHGCGANSNVQCEYVLQYMCDDSKGNPDLRDGTPEDVNDAATTTIPDDEAEIGKKKYGYHETYDWYQSCKTRSRNKGLFIADRQLNKQDARATRQNNNGNRRGLECPEERDYYPYWTPTPWRDIAVLVDDEKRCAYFQKESLNVRKYGECVLPTTIQGVKNGGQDCFNQCNKTEGPCEFCGTSKCCRKNWVTSSSGAKCAMDEGGNNRHECVGPEQLGYAPLNELDCKLKGGQWKEYTHDSSVHVSNPKLLFRTRSS